MRRTDGCGTSVRGNGRRWPVGRLSAAPAAVAALVIVVVVAVGCGGGGGGGGGTGPDPCAITNVRTGTASSWLVGVDGPVDVRWDHTGSAANVRVDLLKAGTAVAVIAASTPNDGFYSWALSMGGQPNGSDFGVRVTALGETGCSGEKNGLTLTDVTGCAFEWTFTHPESVTAGASWPLTWTSGHTSGLVDIELWQDDLGSEPEYVGLIVAGTPDDGSYTWDPVDSFEFGTNDWFVLRLVDSAVPDCAVFSDPFTLVDDVVCGTTVLGFPSGNLFSEGDSVTLSFVQHNGSGHVNLRLLVGSIPVPGGLIALDVPTDQDFTWIVNDYGSTEPDRTRFHIEVTDVANGYCVDVSDVFSIR